MDLDRGAGVPMHAQLADLVRGRIDDGTYPPGARLPTELALAEEFGVNRLTVRQSLAELSRLGIVRARQGVGTFVAERPEPFVVELSLSDWQVAHERAAKEAADRGRSSSEELLDVAQVDAPPAAAEHLGQGPMLWLESVIAVDGEPIIHNQYWTRSEYSPEQVQRRAEAGFGHAALREIVGADMYYAWRSFDAVAAHRRSAAVLGVAHGSPLLRRCGLNADREGRPLLYVQRDAPSGRMQIVIRTEPPA